MSDLVDDFVGPFQTDLFVEVNLFSEVPLHKVDLDAAGLVRIQLIQDLVLLLVLEDISMSLPHLKEVLEEALASREVARLDGGGVVLLILQEFSVETELPNVVSKLLDSFFRPSLDTLQEFALVTVVEVFNRFLELDLCRSERVNLHEPL